jgi:hypothetical protein
VRGALGSAAAAVVAGGLAGCSLGSPPRGNGGAPAQAFARAVASASAVPSVAPPFETPAVGCGPSPCRIFPSASAAFAAALEPAPAVLGIGEAHAQKGSEGIEPAARRFSRELLPLLAGHASDIVIELLLPNPKCAPEAKKARQEQKVVTEHQAATDQNDYVALGTAAKALAIRPHALEPTCEDLSRIAKAGPDVVTVSLDIVTRLASEALARLLVANVAANDSRMIVAYGGMMHNDVDPRPGRGPWSFGPAMKERTAGRYTEVDLIVREAIQDSPTWRSLPWVEGFDRTAHRGEAILLTPAPHGFVLVFPGTGPATPNAPPR